MPGSTRCSPTKRRGAAARSRVVSRGHFSPPRASARGSGDHRAYGGRLGGGGAWGAHWSWGWRWGGGGGGMATVRLAADQGLASIPAHAARLGGTFPPVLPSRSVGCWRQRAPIGSGPRVPTLHEGKGAMG